MSSFPARFWALCCYIRVVLLFVIGVLFIRWALELGLGYFLTVLPEWFMWLLLVISVVDWRIEYLKSRLLAYKNGRAYLYHKSDPRYIAEFVEELCNARTQQLPRIVIAKSSYADRASMMDDLQRPDLLQINESLVEHLEPNELKGVIAHELRHSDALDVKLAGLMRLMKRLFSRFWCWGGWCYLLFGHQGWSETLWCVCWGCGLFLLFHGGVTLLFLGMHRSLEYKADILACLDTRDPAAFIQALRRISLERLRWESVARAKRWKFAERFEEFLESLLRTHPTDNQRQRAIERVFGAIDVPKSKNNRTWSYGSSKDDLFPHAVH